MQSEFYLKKKRERRQQLRQWEFSSQWVLSQYRGRKQREFRSQWGRKQKKKRRRKLRQKRSTTAENAIAVRLRAATSVTTCFLKYIRETRQRISSNALATVYVESAKQPAEVSQLCIKCNFAAKVQLCGQLCGQSARLRPNFAAKVQDCGQCSFAAKVQLCANATLY